ncbi:MAG: O-antigen ligase domain-containing protein [Verrucomicrobia bacterium]|nr:MAG: O-antigen ligase domain-containing protein [Verrucomicrobiota bacterium]TAE87365.1 MAG: O-antigen ligase domain-containing protein [Verrucomicrobiota bacterium]TAF25220.1 MAG: O-antigen ligase domain-containing protein [Verrucomicrobiota bacterium]TAF40866.1 MAG: O-antigen ligase domain-containing protein [Verrucomicrobiota bacterium]
MSLIGLAFFIVVAIALLSVRREYAPVSLLIGCCYMTTGQGLELGSMSLPMYRLFLLVGLLRVLMKGETLVGGVNRIDKLVMWLLGWMFFASFFHEYAPGSGPVYMLGIIFNISLVYYLVRVWCGTVDEVVGVVVGVGFVLLPVAVEMVFEQALGKNLFASLGGIPESVIERNGRLRAQGPFRHPILAGTVGAACLPLMIGIWRANRVAAMTGIAACVMMVMASASSGPVVSMMVGLGVVMCWKYRRHAKRAIWTGLIGYIVIELISNRPAYHVIVTRLDFTGSSTAYYRARLIDTTVKHFSEWWLFGTDYTRHWIPEGIGSVVADGKHMDITNYYIGFGVGAGLLAILLLLAILRRCLAEVLRHVNDPEDDDDHGDRFMIWCLGASLFSHAVSALSIAYFDQSQTFFWLSVATLSSLLSVRARPEEMDDEDESDSLPESAPAPSAEIHAGRPWGPVVETR